MALQQLCEKERFDIVSNCGRSNGLEAWRRLNRRYDPSTGGRKKTLLKHILNPSRVTLDELSGAIEKWTDSVRMYERRKDRNGDRSAIPDDIKISALEALVPKELEKHMLLNSDMFDTFARAMEGIGAYSMPAQERG